MHIFERVGGRIRTDTLFAIFAIVAAAIPLTAAVCAAYTTNMVEVLGRLVGTRPPPLATWDKYSKEIVRCRSHWGKDLSADCKVLLDAAQSDIDRYDAWQDNHIKEIADTLRKNGGHNE